jgi:chromosomal replication initiation ATPase DnaA
MSPQLSFQFKESLTYSSDTFLIHEGVLQITDTLVTLASEERSSLVSISAEAGAGKTHLATFCAGAMQALGKPARILRGDDLVESGARNYAAAVKRSERIQPGEMVVVDDADRWLQEPGSEGLFTAIADRILQAKGILVLMLVAPPTELRLPAQVRSRLTAGLHFSVGLPAERYLDEILRAMAKQRGLRLTPAKRAFILKRVPRTVSALSGYMTRLHEVGTKDIPSTSFEALASALGETI